MKENKAHDKLGYRVRPLRKREENLIYIWPTGTNEAWVERDTYIGERDPQLFWNNKIIKENISFCRKIENVLGTSLGFADE